MKRQKGQAVVEFAIVLPFFLMLVFGIFYSGFLFADYMTLSNVARSSAREAALLGANKYDEIKSSYRGNTKLLTNLYTWPEEDGSFEISSGTDVSDSVMVTIRTNLNTGFPGISAMDFLGLTLPRTYTIQYSMHDEMAGS